MMTSANRRWWALAAMALSLLVIGLDTTVLNVALPTIAVDLDASTSQLQWFADAYLLVLAALLLPAGMLGDRLGRRRLTLAALTVFGAGSLWCAYASSPASLIGARILLGVGAAVLIPLVMSSVVVLFAPEERARAIAVMSVATIIGLPAGPLVGGALLNHFWWGSVFLLNVPVVAAALVAAAVLLPTDGPASRGRVDWLGIGLSTTGLVGLTYGLIEGPVRGWTDPPVLAALLVGVALLAAFARWQYRTSGEPLMDLALWRNRSFHWGVIGATLASFGLFGILFVLPQYLRSVSGVDALGTGVRTLPLVLGMIVGLQGGIRLGARVGFTRMTALGFAALAGGLAAGTLTRVNTAPTLIAGWTALAGLGTGMALIGAQNAALITLDKTRAGAGSAAIQAMRQVGSVTGIAALGAVLNAVYRSHLHLTAIPDQVAGAMRASVTSAVAVGTQLRAPAIVHNAQHAFTNAMHAVLWTAGGVCLLAAVLMWLFLPNTPSAITNARQSERVAAETQAPTN